LRPLDIDIRVPFEIIVGDLKNHGGNSISTTNKTLLINPDRISSLGENDFAFRLHFKNGFLYELEVYNLSGNQLSFALTRNNVVVVCVYSSKLNDFLHDTYFTDP